MQLTSARNVQFGFACKVPLTRFNFLANFQCWGINLNSSCIIPILSICRGRQESASGPGYSNKNVDPEQIRRPLPSHDGSWYLIECNCGNCFLVAVHKKPVPGCNQCRHINIITGVSGYQCLGVFRSCPGGGRCGLRLQSDEWCSDGVKTVQQCMVSPGGGVICFVCSQFVYHGFHYKCMLGCHLNVTLPWSSPRHLWSWIFVLQSSPIIRHDTGQLQESGATAERQSFTDIPAQSIQPGPGTCIRGIKAIFLILIFAYNSF